MLPQDGQLNGFCGDGLKVLADRPSDPIQYNRFLPLQREKSRRRLKMPIPGKQDVCGDLRALDRCLVYVVEHNEVCHIFLMLWGEVTSINDCVGDRSELLGLLLDSWITQIGEYHDV